MRITAITVLALLTAFSAAAGSITSLSPSSFTVESGEHFIRANGSGLGDTILYSGPAGTFKLGISSSTVSSVTAWVPTRILQIPGRYSITIDGPNGTSGPAYFDIVDPSAPPFRITFPEAVIYEALSREGRGIKFDVTGVGGKEPDPAPRIDCFPSSGSIFPIGKTTVKCTATNFLGEKSSGDFPIVVFDGHPAVSVPTKDIVADTREDYAIVDFTSSATDTVDGQLAVNCNYPSGSRFPIGVTNVACYATDSAQNSSTSNFNVDVRDSSGIFKLFGPGTLTVEADNPEGGYQVDYTIRHSGTTDSNPEIRCDPKPGTLFLFGATTVNCEGQDRYGKIASTKFEVIVADTIPPLISRAFARPEMLLKPDGSWQFITLDVVAEDVVELKPRCTIYDVTANQPITAEDYSIAGDLDVWLRHTRDKSGNRIYEIHVKCIDGFENSTLTSANVLIADEDPGPDLSRTKPATDPAKRRGVRH